MIDTTRFRARRPAAADLQESAAGPSWRQGPLRLDVLAVALVIATYAVIQYLVFPGPQHFDPQYYFVVARYFPHVPANYWTLRIGLIAPIRLPIILFGPSEVATYFVPVAAVFLLAACSFAMMRILFDDRIVAAATALVVVLNPDYLLNAPYIFPDTVGTATLAAGFLCIVLGRRQAGREPRWTSDAAAIAAGALFGWTYLIREFSPILLPAVVVAVAIFRFPRRRVALLIGSALAVYAIEPIYGAIRYGNPFERIHLLIADKSTPTGQHLAWTPFRAKVTNVFDGALVFPRLLLSWGDGWVFIALIVIFVVALVRFRGRPLLVLAGWLFSFWAVMTLLAVIRKKSGDPYVEVGNVRYWYPALPALIMGGFGALTMLIRGAAPTLRRVRLAQLAAVLVAVLALVPGTVQFSHCAAKNIWRTDPAADWDGIRSWLGTPQGQSFHLIQTDYHSSQTLVPYTVTRFGSTVWRGAIGRGPRPDKPVPDPNHDKLLLVNSALTSRAAASRLLGVWSPVYVSKDGRLALLAPTSVAHPVPAAQRELWLGSFGQRRAVPGQCGTSPYETPGSA